MVEAPGFSPAKLAQKEEGLQPGPGLKPNFSDR